MKNTHSKQDFVDDPSSDPGDSEAGKIYDPEEQVIHLKRDRILIHTDKLLRLEAKEVEIHGDDRVRIDAGGAGVTYFPNKTDDWRQGLPTANHPPSPPEHSP